MNYISYNKKVIWNQRELDIRVTKRTWSDGYINYRTNTNLEIEGCEFRSSGIGDCEEKSIENCIQGLVDNIKYSSSGNKVKVAESWVESSKESLQKAIKTQQVAEWLMKQFNL